MEFVSSSDLQAHRKHTNEAREAVLQKAKKKFEKKQQRIARKKESGEDVWILPALSEQIDRKEKEAKEAYAALELKESSSKGHTVKKKKHKKEKKRKKKKTAASSSEDEWHEAKQQGAGVSSTEVAAAATHSAVTKAPPPKRDEWMTLEQDLVPCSTREELRERILQDKERCKREQDNAAADQPGQHARELNPYWKDGGTGLPSASSGAELKLAAGASDGGLAWYRTAYEQCVKQAANEKKTLEEVAGAHWGSLERLETLLMEAERSQELESASGGSRRLRYEQSLSEKPATSNRGSSPRRERSHAKRSISISSSGSDTSHQSDDRSHNRKHSYRAKAHRSTLPSVEKRYGDAEELRKARIPKESRQHISKSPSVGRRREHRSRSRSVERQRRRRTRSRSRSNDMQSKSRSTLRSPLAHRRNETTGRRGFLKPAEDDNRAHNHDNSSTVSRLEAGVRVGSSHCSGHAVVSLWRKPGHYSKARDSSRNRPEVNTNLIAGARSSGSERAVSSSSSSPSGSEESDDGKREHCVAPPSTGTSTAIQPEPLPPPRPLSEAQMNELGAAILRAELMGDEQEASQLRSRLDIARQCSSTGQFNDTRGGEKDNDTRGGEKESPIIVLSRVDHQGNLRPAAASADSGLGRSGRHSKATKTPTHNASGERERYFADDDKFDLRAMVHKERFTSAEDQNSMFRKNVSAASQRTDDDFQVDDIFLQKAMRRQSDSVLEDKQRAFAQSQSRQVARTLAACRLCFDQCTKHLVVAIGEKVYLTLPDHEALSEGHCLIVPMQHVISSTSMDEDVYLEMQTFRKALVKMFQENDEDCVFMECSLALKKQPHAAIECVPLPVELGDMAPIYFKKAIMESESEWAQNKKLVDLVKTDIRRAIPKGFPYFAVDFGLQNGFAHVVEDEKLFPSYFGQEVVGGMLDAEPRLWRKPLKETFEVQRQKVLQFAERWKPFDITLKSSSSLDS